MSESDHTVKQLFKISEEQAIKVNCWRAAIIGAVFMLVGVSLDLVVYPEHLYREGEGLQSLFWNRVITAALLLGFGWLCKFANRDWVSRLVVHTVAMLPIVSISIMIWQTDGVDSPYWAGLNLVLMGATVLLRWGTLDSAINAMLCIGSYFFAIYQHHLDDFFLLPGGLKATFIPGYFIFVTGAIAATATYFYNGSRFREFCLAMEVAATNKELRNSNLQLAENIAELESANVKLKEQGSLLVQSEKLSSLGRMSAGIVHEVNNPLNYSKIAIHTLKSFKSSIDLEEQDDFLEVIADAEEGVVRVIGIISDLRSFTRGDTVHKEPIKVASFTESARKLASSILADIELTINVDPAHEIEGNERQLCQLLVNFMQNSARAIDVKSARLGSFQGSISLSSESSDEGVSLVMRDNGCGISKEDIDRIFEPFFTKNDVGEGMGLGLSICHRILDQHNATISVESEVDEFTEFRIWFEK
ncbi:MAG: sensor histidine kinase [Akkermansiaceae bacterium]